MVNAPVGTAQYLARFGSQSIMCSPYALTKLGVDRSHCFLKIEDYMILCIPFQFGFKRSLFLAALSREEQAFFQKYVDEIINLSISFTAPGRNEAIGFFIRCSLDQINAMKNRENVGVFTVEFKNTPDEMVRMMGSFMEHLEKLHIFYEDYGKTMIRLSPETSMLMGYNMYAAIMDGRSPQGRRIQVFNLSTKNMEYLQAAGVPVLAPGTAASYQLFFRKYRVFVSGTVESAVQLPQGIIRTMVKLNFSPELVEILDMYWINVRTMPQGVR